MQILFGIFISWRIEKIHVGLLTVQLVCTQILSFLQPPRTKKGGASKSKSAGGGKKGSAAKEEKTEKILSVSFHRFNDFKLKLPAFKTSC